MEALRLFNPEMLDVGPETDAGQLTLWGTPQAAKALRRASLPVLNHLLGMCRFESEAAVVAAEIARKQERSRSAVLSG